MKTNSLAFRTAKQHVDQFAAFGGSEPKTEHAEAMDCLDCEAFLQMGIDAFEWLMRADRAYRLALYRGEREHEMEVEEALKTLCRSWLRPCDFAEKWIDRQLGSGFALDNLARFRHCVEEMTALVESWEGGEGTIPKAIADLRDSAVREHLDGETAEFI